jgi:hypothetical protein
MNISINGSTINISGTIKFPFTSAYIIAACPIDTMQNYSGSGLPFPNEQIAFENTPNKFILTSNIFNTSFIYPNSYYLPDGKTIVLPTICLIIDGKIIEKKELPNLLPLKTLSYRKSRSENFSHFYGSKDYILPISNAENVMRSYSDAKIIYDIA